MRTLTITVVAAFVFLLGLQLTTDSRGDDREERGASQAVIAGSIKCFFGQEFRSVALDTFGGLGIIATPIPTDQFSSFGVFSGPLAQECSELIPSLTEQVPRRVCEIGSTLQQGDAGIELLFLCTGRTDAVIAGVGKMARAVNRLGQL
jgi:hypothetical protein